MHFEETRDTTKFNNKNIQNMIKQNVLIYFKKYPVYFQNYQGPLSHSGCLVVFWIQRL